MMAPAGVTARPHPDVVEAKGATMPVNRDQRTTPLLVAGRRLPGCADIESETE